MSVKKDITRLADDADSADDFTEALSAYMIEMDEADAEELATFLTPLLYEGDDEDE